MHAKLFSFAWLFVTWWTVTCQASLSMGFSRQEYWSGLPFPPPGYLPDSGIKPSFLCLLHWQVGSSPLAPSGKPYIYNYVYMDRGAWRAIQSMGSQKIRHDWGTATFLSLRYIHIICVCVCVCTYIHTLVSFYLHNTLFVMNISANIVGFPIVRLFQWGWGWLKR